MSVSDSDHDGDRSSKGGDDETVQFDAVQELLELDSATLLQDTEAVPQACALWSRPEVVEAIVTGPQSAVLQAKLKAFVTIIAMNASVVAISAADVERLSALCEVLGIPVRFGNPKSQVPLASSVPVSGKVEKEDKFVAKLLHTQFVKETVSSVDAVRAVAQQVQLQLRMSRTAVSALCQGHWSPDLVDNAASDMWHIVVEDADVSLDDVSKLLLAMTKVKTLLRLLIPEDHLPCFEEAWAYLEYSRDVLLSQSVSVEAIVEMLSSIFADLRNLATIQHCPARRVVAASGGFGGSQGDEIRLRGMLEAYDAPSLSVHVSNTSLHSVWQDFRNRLSVDAYAAKAFRERDEPSSSRTMTQANPVALVNQFVAGFGVPKLWAKGLRGHCAMHLLAPGMCPKSSFCTHVHGVGEVWLAQQTALESLLGSATVAELRRRIMEAAATLVASGRSGGWGASTAPSGAQAHEQSSGHSSWSAFSGSKAKKKQSPPQPASAE